MAKLIAYGLGPFAGNSKGGASRAAKRLAVLLILTVLVLAAPFCPVHADVPDPFGSVPIDGDAAMRTLPDRQQYVITKLACGEEDKFLNNFNKDLSGEDTIQQLIAKVYWLQLNGPTQVSSGPPVIRIQPPRENPRIANADGVTNQPFQPPTVACQGPINGLSSAQMTAAYGPSCTGAIGASGLSLSIQCMTDQVNKALTNMQQGAKQLGSSDDLCHITAKSIGEWDVAIRDLLRIYFLDGSVAGHAAVLTDTVKIHMVDDLFSVSGSLGPSGYPVLGCGNTERDTGDAQDRADEGGWISNAVDDMLGDAKDILGFFALLLGIFLTLGAVALAAAGLPAGLAGLVVAVPLLWAGLSAIPLQTETENHRFMIESARYLVNKILIGQLQQEGSATDDLDADQHQIKSWFMGEFKRVLTSDFTEYNSRPYNRYTTRAMLNLYDFSGDNDLRTGAQAMLDFTAAKFAVGSDQGRRLPPFRRHRDAIKNAVDEGPDGHTRDDAFFYAGSDDDHQIQFMMYYTGQSQQVDGAPPSAMTDEMADGATSSYQPDKSVLKLAIQQGYGSFEQIHGSILETYARGPGYLITAGAVPTGPAYPGALGIGGLVVDLTNDSGAGNETTLLLTGARERATADILHFRGSDPMNETFDHNTCVWANFACGVGFFFPDILSGIPTAPNTADPTIVPGSQPTFDVKGRSTFHNCLTQVAGAPGEWFFIDTSTCPVLKGSSRLLIILFRATCPSGFSCGTKNDFGFFEVVQPTGDEDFASVERRVIQDNPVSALMGSRHGSSLGGTYHAGSKNTIVFDAYANQERPHATGIISINGIPQPQIDDVPQLANGPFLSGGNGIMTIGGQGTGAVTYDLSDTDHAKRSVR